jgi:hypothetical protein
MISAVAAELADAIRAGAVQAGADSPQVRGSDWQTALVTAVGSDGTVTASGVIARRVASYQSPAVGDLICLTNSSSGNWLAVGRIAPATTAGTWQTLSLASGWSAWGAPYWTPAYRVNGDGTASLSGLARAPASTTTAATVGTLPAEATPSTTAHFPTVINSNLHSALEIGSNGLVRINNFTGTAAWAGLDVARYRLY